MPKGCAVQLATFARTLCAVSSAAEAQQAAFLTHETKDRFVACLGKPACAPACPPFNVGVDGLSLSPQYTTVGAAGVVLQLHKAAGQPVTQS
jgi:hypothetical protein